METKTCRACGENKPFTEFNRDRTKADGRRAICRACRSVSDARKITPTNRSGVRKITSAQSQQKVQPEAQPADPKIKHVAYQRAMKRLIEMYPREFRQLVGKEMVYLGAEKRWSSVGG